MASDGHNSLSRWSSNADSVSLSDTLDVSRDKPTSKPAGRYGLFIVHDQPENSYAVNSDVSA